MGLEPTIKSKIFFLASPSKVTRKLKKVGKITAITRNGLLIVMESFFLVQKVPHGYPIALKLNKMEQGRHQNK